ncbi:hypothetical protein R1flu_027529 [Riccia fluitans]|uniref:Uncharacterized protein n=1 Tax=Riccia fluitans TaxID=41844 RepID=A0ABD1XLY4_9MARC
MTQVKDRNPLRLKEKIVEPKETLKEEIEVFEEEMTSEDVGIEVPPVAKLGKPSGVSQVTTTNTEGPFYLEEIISKFTEARKAKFAQYYTS